jgi:acetyl-CoA carboxylase biotin carboxyl carrier protein
MAKRRERGDDRPEWTPADLAALAAEHDLAEIEVERAGMRIRVVRRHPTAMHAGPALAHAAVAEPASAAATAASAEVPANVSIVTAPMVGTFYRSPSPEAAPFVSEGDVVKAGQTLCIIEAMKLMNEIESRSGGRITRILVENGQPVEFGQPLFHLEESR